MLDCEDELSRRAVAAYWGLAIGDALGASVEFMTPSEIKHKYGVHDRIRGGGWLKLKQGQVTDDTEMSLALGEAIIQQGEVQPVAIAQSFDRWLQTKPIDTGLTVRRGIIHFRHTGIPNVVRSDDAGNGACMRVLPVALSTVGRSKSDIEEVSRQQAHITHNNSLSDAGCEAVIHILQGALLGSDKSWMMAGPVEELIASHPPFDFIKRRIENPSGYIVDTLVAVLHSFFETENFRDCLIDVVNRGGDADTTGAIAGMIAGAYYGLDQIPIDWWSVIDDDIRHRCHDQAIKLLRLSSLCGWTESWGMKEIGK